MTAGRPQHDGQLEAALAATPTPYLRRGGAAMNAQDVTAFDADDEALGPYTKYELQRAEWFEHLGFTGAQALHLATARDARGHLVTVHDVRRTLDLGASVSQAFEIFA
jgi:hypothetical protein